MGEDQIDDLAYSLRAVTAQLMNMKAQSRQIPKQWASKFEVFYAKITSVQQEETPKNKTLQRRSRTGRTTRAMTVI